MPIDRSGGRASRGRARAPACGSSARASLLGIYPEGTRSPDGRLYRGKTGVARMALEAGVPVIPVAMIDTDKIQPPGQGLPEDHAGSASGSASRWTSPATRAWTATGSSLRSITDEIMYELMQLSGQEYVDIYATKAKTEIAAGRRPATVVTIGGELADEPVHAA